jgi:hypothetical protein
MHDPDDILDVAGLGAILILSRILLILLLLAVPFTVSADDSEVKERLGEELFARYQNALLSQKDAVKNVEMEVLMEGKIPRLKKEGKMSALKRVSAVGGVTWKLLGFWGDDTVKKEVMARYMQAEQEAANGNSEKSNSEKPEKSEKPDKSDKSKNADISITPDNYNFKYKGLNERDNRQVHIFELKPKHKRLGLFKGELWLDPETCLPVRESGRLVKNPSVFIKKMEFVRDYEIRDGVAYLKRMESQTQTRIVGKAELNIEYAPVTKRQLTADEAVEEARAAKLQ